MRWFVVLLLLPMGGVAKEVEIPCTPWYEGRLTSSEAVLIGEVIGVSSEVHQSAAQVLPEESCIIRLESIFGTSPELVGATSVKLHARYNHDTYQQLEPDWGVYRHLRAGQKVMALLHRYEGQLAIGRGALMVLPEQTRGQMITPSLASWLIGVGAAGLMVGIWLFTRCQQAGA